MLGWFYIMEINMELENLYLQALAQVNGDIKYMNHDGVNAFGHLNNGLYVALGQEACRYVYKLIDNEEAIIYGVGNHSETGEPFINFLPKCKIVC